MNEPSPHDRRLFENLFVLELANNHWGSLARGLSIIRQHGTAVRYNGVRAAIKLQFRDVDNFIHPDYRGNGELRYIAKTESTRMSAESFRSMVSEIERVGCMPMATPFDEASVAFCELLDLPIIKVASSDVNDWPLLERIAQTRRPVIISSGGATEHELDSVVDFFDNRGIPLAINHCVSRYPCDDSDLELNQIDYLRTRYPTHVIGLSTHEYRDWQASMLISYAKGARTWERHIDIEDGTRPVTPYCSLPSQIDEWFRAHATAVTMCGGSRSARRVIAEAERDYLTALIRGVYARRRIEPGYSFDHASFTDDFYLAVPLRRGQLSSREILNGLTLCEAVEVDAPLMAEQIGPPYGDNPQWKALLHARGHESR